MRRLPAPLVARIEPSGGCRYSSRPAAAAARSRARAGKAHARRVAAVRARRAEGISQQKTGVLQEPRFFSCYRRGEAPSFCYFTVSNNLLTSIFYGRWLMLVYSRLRFLTTFCLSISRYNFYLFIDLRFLSSPIGRRFPPLTNFSLFFGCFPLFSNFFPWGFK